MEPATPARSAAGPARGAAEHVADRAGADLLDLVRATPADTDDDIVVLAVRVAAP